MKSVRIPNFFWPVFSRIRTEYAGLQGKSGKCGKIRTGKTPNTDTFCTVTDKPQNTPPNTDTDEPNQMYTNTNLKICQYLRLHVKMIRFPIKKPLTF